MRCAFVVRLLVTDSFCPTQKAISRSNRTAPTCGLSERPPISCCCWYIPLGVDAVAIWWLHGLLEVRCMYARAGVQHATGVQFEGKQRDRFF